MANILNPELVAARKNAVIEALKLGHSYTAALKIAGLNPRSAAQWRESDLAFEEAVQKHLQYEPRAVHNQKRMPTRTAKDILPEQTGDVVEDLCKELEIGMPLEMACLTVDVSRSTVMKWMQEDPDIRRRINRAQGLNVRYWITCLREGAANDWKAAVAYLERIFPHMFAEVKAVEITQRTEERTTANIIDVTPHDTVKRLAALSDDELLALIEGNPNE